MRPIGAFAPAPPPPPKSLVHIRSLAQGAPKPFKRPARLIPPRLFITTAWVEMSRPMGRNATTNG
ncbi:MAG: hypothetical protein IPK82_30110 [Polyangiaceae bacterium]|nr:hypothetical protein [Polyangiaceae bacterium]